MREARAKETKMAVYSQTSLRQCEGQRIGQGHPKTGQLRGWGPRPLQVVEGLQSKNKKPDLSPQPCNEQRFMSVKADLEKGTLPFVAMEQAQDVGKWPKSRLPICSQLVHPWMGGNAESLAKSHTNVIIYKCRVT